jgi:hypothetical protein
MPIRTIGYPGTDGYFEVSFDSIGEAVEAAYRVSKVHHDRVFQLKFLGKTSTPFIVTNDIDYDASTLAKFRSGEEV